MPVEIDGATELRAAMQFFAPNLAYAMQQRISKALIPIVNDARELVPGSAPLSTWQAYSTQRKGTFPRFNALEIRHGIKYSTEPTKPNRSGFSYAASIINASAAGAIYETAGRKNPSGRPKNPYMGKEYDLTQIDPELRAAYKKKLKNKKYSMSANPHAGQQFISSMPALVDGRPKKMRGKRGRNMKGRLIYKAWAKDQGHAYDAVNRAIDDAIKQFTSRGISKAFNTTTYRRSA